MIQSSYDFILVHRHHSYDDGVDFDLYRFVHFDILKLSTIC